MEAIALKKDPEALYRLAVHKAQNEATRGMIIAALGREGVDRDRAAAMADRALAECGNRQRFKGFWQIIIGVVILVVALFITFGSYLAASQSGAGIVMIFMGIVRLTTGVDPSD